MRWTDAELVEELDRYQSECEVSGLAPLSVDSYVRYGRMFLRWRSGDYRPRGAVGPARQPSRGSASMEDLVADHRAYEVELRQAKLQPQAVHTYLIHSDQFLRWLSGAFDPGSRLVSTTRLMTRSREPSRGRSMTVRGDSVRLCWCGCGESTQAGSAFVASHDRIAEAAVIRSEYGSSVEFLRRHGFGPGPEDRHARDAATRR